MDAAPTMTVRRDDSLPKLAWYAELDRRAGRCDVEVGPFVEVDPSASPRWVVSGLWDGDFGEGRFDDAEHVYGNGLRVTDDEVVIVPAHTMLDRVLYLREGSVWRVSNSLVVLLGRSGARLDPRADHRRWSESTCYGVHNYVRQFAIAHPRLSVMHQVVFEALHLDRNGEASFHFHDRPRQFHDFLDYQAELDRGLRALWANARDARRARPMRVVATSSRGYDSPTVLALWQGIVGQPLISWSAPRSNTRVPRVLQRVMGADLTNDDGAEISRMLGAEPRHLDLEESKLPAEREAWFWAATQSSPELLFHSLLTEADGHDVPTIFLGGHNGDGMWDLHLSPLRLTGQLIRESPSGLSLNEARLRYGVVDCSPAFMFARSVASLHRVSNSEELVPWRVGSGYDRPICRRILEGRGVPRRAFGWGKRAVAEDAESPRGRELRELFFQQSGWSPFTESLYRDLNLGLYLATRVSSFVKHRGNRSKMLRDGARPDGKRRLARFADLQKQTFLLATGWLADRFARP
jgi:hypothetical protein